MALASPSSTLLKPAQCLGSEPGHGFVPYPTLYHSAHLPFSLLAELCSREQMRHLSWQLIEGRRLPFHTGGILSSCSESRTLGPAAVVATSLAVDTQVSQR